MSASKEPYGEMSLLDFPEVFAQMKRTAGNTWCACAGRRANPAPDVTRPWDLSKPAGFFVQSLPEANLGGFRNAVSSEPYSLCRSGSGRFI